MKTKALLFAVLLAGCPKTEDLPPRPVPHYIPSDRDAPDTPLGMVCLRLRVLGCPEGYPNRAGKTCYETLLRASEVVVIPESCIRASPSVVELRACGDEQTMRVTCAQVPSNETEPVVP